ncbi:hypothetical protein NYP18_07225 [Corynebacterium sp. YIM 101645]|uniref:ABC3 transporter permease C-terminal domain-containing protein n=1 Tax=Corynebacterium lemuris TaxID=1859292 RepID=A0ABT2FW33_9CORY|nr:ABC transporter permease [Corynebacterium lemuris]MCS5479446.1 hypothetical protein [Corynebacterium lemuris]
MSLTFRLAWRDLNTHRTTAILAMALFALPLTAILALAAAGSSATTQATDPLHRYSSAFLSYGTCSGIPGPSSLCLDPDHVHFQDLPGHERLTQQLGEDLTFHPLYQTGSDITLSSGTNTTATPVTAFDAPDPDRESFPAPGEIHLTFPTAFILDVREGDAVRMGERSLTVASVSDADAARVQVNPLDFPGGDMQRVQQWFSPAPHLPEAQPGTGIRTTDSPVGRTDPRMLTTFNRLPSDMVLPVILMGLMALLLMVAIIGPIFAVAGRRQRRTMGLLSASGGSPRTLRRILLWQAVIVAALGGALGVTASLPLGWLVLRILGVEATRFLWPWDLALAGWLFALACAVVAAIQPALAAGREDPVVALAGGSTQRRPRLRPLLLIGPAVMAIGIIGSATGPGLFMLITGIGVLLSGGATVWALSRAGGHLPLPARLAARDIIRQATRSAPGVAAVAGVVFVAAMAAAFPATTSTLGSTANLVMVSATQQLTSIGRHTDNITQVGEQLGNGHITRHDLFIPAPDQIHVTGAHPLPSAWQQAGIFSDIIIAGPELLHTLADLSEEDHTRAAAALQEGTGILGVPTPDQKLTFSDGQTLETVTVPSDPEFGLLITPETATALGITTTYVASALIPEQPMSELLKARLAVTNGGLDHTLATVHIPGVDPNVIVFTLAPVLLSLITAFAVAALIIYLSAAESRRDLHTLWSVGAQPGILRHFTAAQGTMIATAGMLLGLAAGLLTAIATAIDSGSGPAITTHWLNTPLLVLTIGLPVTGWLTGTLFGALINRRAGSAPPQAHSQLLRRNHQNIRITTTMMKPRTR